MGAMTEADADAIRSSLERFAAAKVAEEHEAVIAVRTEHAASLARLEESLAATHSAAARREAGAEQRERAASQVLEDARQRAETIDAREEKHWDEIRAARQDFVHTLAWIAEEIERRKPSAGFLGIQIRETDARERFEELASQVLQRGGLLREDIEPNAR